MLMPGDVDWEVRQATPLLIYRDFNLLIVVVALSSPSNREGTLRGVPVVMRTCGRVRVCA
jgi:hypothetical protein